MAERKQMAISLLRSENASLISFLVGLRITFLFEVFKIFFLKFQIDGKNKGGANYLLLV